MTTQEAATTLGCSKRFVVTLIKQKKLSARKNKYGRWEVAQRSVNSRIRKMHSFFKMRTSRLGVL